jgi:multiple antibiotic resistance protein
VQHFSSGWGAVPLSWFLRAAAQKWRLPAVLVLLPIGGGPSPIWGGIGMGGGVFEVPLSMVRIVGGIILMRIGFSLFLPSAASGMANAPASASADADVAFVPLAMPLMFGPGAIATVLGMASLVRHPLAQILPLAAITLAILATMGTTYLFLAYADIILGRIGPRGIDAATRIVGFFVAAMGMGLIFHGVTEAIHTYGLAATH